MKKVLLATIIALMAINLGLYAQEKAQAEPVPVQQQTEEISPIRDSILKDEALSNGVKLELIYQKNFDEIIGPEGFPSPEIKQILKEKDIPQEDKDWLLNSLRIEIARGKKILYTNDGKAVQLPDDLKSIITSGNLKYMIVYASHYDYGGMSREDAKIVQGKASEALRKSIEWGMKWEEAGRTEEYMYIDSVYYWIKMRDSLGSHERAIQFGTKENKQVLIIETETGRVLWQKEGWKYSLTGKGEDVFPPSYISDDGKTSISVPGLGPVKHLYNSIYFYDENGNEKKVVTGLYGLHGCHDLSSDGEMFCTLIQIKRNDAKVGAVAAYDEDGNELWITEIPGTWPDANPCIAVSPNHKYVAASIGGTSFLDDKGIVINTYNYKTYYPGFSFDGRYLITGTLRDTIYFIHTSDSKVVWQNSLGGHSHKKPVMTSDGCLIFFVSQLAGQHPANFLDKNGNIIWNGSHELKNAVGLSPSGYFFTPSSEPDLIVYRILSEVPNEDQ